MQAEKQFHLVDLVNEAIFHLIEAKVELPSCQRLLRLVAHALQQSDISQKKLLNQSLNRQLKGKLDALLQSVPFGHRRLRLTVRFAHRRLRLTECQYQRTPFYELKEPPETPSASAIIKEIQLLQRLRSLGKFDTATPADNLSFDALKQINNDRIKHFFEIAKSYKSNELYDLVPETLDHCRCFGGGVIFQLGVNRNGVAFDVPVDLHSITLITRSPFGHQILSPG